MDLRPDQCGGMSKLAVPCKTAEDPAGVRGREKERSAVGFGSLKVSGCEMSGEREICGWVWLAES